MENPNFVFCTVNVVTGLIFILLSIPLIAKKVPMNRLYGFRIRKAFASEENWYKINHYGGKQLLYWSSLLVAVGVICFMYPAQEHQAEVEQVIRTVGPVIVCPAISVIKTVIYSKSLP